MINRSEHPRPDFYRPLWQTLNGTWQFQFDRENTGIDEKWYSPEVRLEKNIEVPFCYQSRMSGINDQSLINVVWYRRKFTVPDEYNGKRIHICFGAVDYEAKVYINGEFIGCHEGGYSPFRIDVTNALIQGENDLCVRVEDQPDRQQPRGKQYWKEGWKRCWYIPCTGIWQSVYMEAVSELHLQNILVTPDIDMGEIRVQMILNRIPDEDTKLVLNVFNEGRTIKTITVNPDSKVTYATISMLDPDGIEDIHLWRPEDPELYDLMVIVENNGNKQDFVKTYFGMRKIEVRNGYILLNNRACYLRMVLDQGYWPDSLMTPPSADAVRKDVEWTLRLGYNGARKHQKIEDPLYYYWADKLGLLVWGELPAAHEFTVNAVRNTAETMADFIMRDMNHPSVIAWVPINESWGMTRLFANLQMQSTAKMLYYECKALDPSRMVSTNDGWETVETDILGLHDYSAHGEAITFHFNDGNRWRNYAADSRLCCSTGYTPTGNEALMVTEYGGIAIDNTGNGWGYNGKVQNEAEYLQRFKDETDGIRKIRECRGYCYTQLTDVQQERNGILYMDRTPKIDPERFRELNENPMGER